MDKEYFQELLEKIPEAKHSELRKLLLKMAIPEFIPTDEESEAIKRGREQFEKGEFVSYKSFEEMEQDIMND